jgi:hypothetical protein
MLKMWMERAPASGLWRGPRDSVTAMGRHKTATLSLPAPFVSAGISVVVAVVYLGIIYRQDHRLGSRAIFIASLLTAIAFVLVASTRVAGPVQRAVLLAGGANSLIALGFLGLFSIGLPLLVAGAFAMPATARALEETPRPWGPLIVAVSSLGAVALIIAGLLGTK